MIQIGAGTAQPGKPIALIENLMKSGLLSVSSQVAGSEGANALDGTSFDWWTPVSLPASMTVSLTGSEQVDCLGIAAHNLGSSGATIILERDVGGWTHVQTITPTDDSTIIALFPMVSAASWRVRITGTASPSIGILMLGKRIVFPSGADGDFIPMEWGERIEVLGGTTLGGQFLGNRFISAGGRAQVRLGRVSRLWYKSTGKVFTHHYNRGRGFFFAEWPTTLRDSAAYCWRDEGDGEMNPTLVEQAYVSIAFDVHFYVPILPDPVVGETPEVTGGGGYQEPDVIGGGGASGGAGAPQGVVGGGISDPDVIGGGGVFGSEIIQVERTYTDGIPETLLFSTLIPAPSGTPSYALQGAAPAGVSIDADSIDVTGAQADGATATVRRTDNTGQRDFVFTFYKSTYSVSVNPDTGIATFSFGADTRADVLVSADIEGSDFDGVVATFTIAQAQAGYLATDPVIGFTTDTDVDGKVDSGDVLAVQRPALPVYDGAGSEPVVSGSWADITGPLGDTAEAYVADGSEDTQITYTASISGQSRASNAILVDTGEAGGGGGSLFADSFDYTAGTALTANGYTSVLQTGVPVLQVVAGSGAVEMTASNGTHIVTHSLPPDPGSDDVYCELDVQMSAIPTLNATRFHIRNDSDDIRVEVNRAAITITKTGVTIATGTWTPTAATQYTFRLEMDVTNDEVRFYIDGVLKANEPAPAGLVAPHDRTFNFGMQTSSAAGEVTYFRINAVRIGAL